MRPDEQVRGGREGQPHPLCLYPSFQQWPGWVNEAEPSGMQSPPKILTPNPCGEGKFPAHEFLGFLTLAEVNCPDS